MTYTDDISTWYESLDECKADGLSPVKLTSLYGLFRLKDATPSDIKAKVKQYALDLVERSKELGRDAPLSMAACIVTAREYYNLSKKENSDEITLDNIEPIQPLQYLLHSRSENRYYIKDFRGLPLKELFDLVYSGADPFVNNLVNWIADGSVYLLFTKDMIDDMTAMLTRVHNAKLSVKGKLSYPLFLEILELTVKYEDYKDFARELTGYRTVCHTFDQGLEELWRKAIK